jgi:hypothetical protein
MNLPPLYHSSGSGSGSAIEEPKKQLILAPIDKTSP